MLICKSPPNKSQILISPQKVLLRKYYSKLTLHTENSVLMVIVSLIIAMVIVTLTSLVYMCTDECRIHWHYYCLQIIMLITYEEINLWFSESLTSFRH